MPELKRLLGIVIRMRTRGEHPPPHVHVHYQHYECMIRISDGCLHEGTMPLKKYKIAKKWVVENKEYLEGLWNEHNS